MPNEPQEQVLDLDELAPTGHGLVKLNGKKYKLYPPKIKNLIRLIKVEEEYYRLAAIPETERDGDEVLAAVEMLKDALEPIMPELKKDDVDLSAGQAAGLLAYALSLSVPEEVKAAAPAGDGATAEKKTPDVVTDSPAK